MANISVTNTFTNSTTADATQVNQNFTDIINGTSDATKDLSFLNLTTGSSGSANLQGNVTLGSASSKNLVFTGSVASSIPFSANATWNLGAATLAPLSIYLGNSTFSVRLIAPTLTASWTLTFPTTGGTSGQFLKTDGTGVGSWNYPFSRVAKTGNYTVAASDTHIDCDSSGGTFSITVPAASATNSGQTVFIRKTDTSLTTVSIITGLTTSVDTNSECIQINSNGAAWAIVERTISSKWVSYTPTSNATINTTWTGFYRRVGDSIEGTVRCSFAAGQSQNISVNFTIPSGLTIDTTKLPASVTTASNIFGSFSFDDGGVNAFIGTLGYVNTTTLSLMYASISGANIFSAPVNPASNLPSDVVAGDFWWASFRAPISGWNS